jgi:protein gp37
MRVEIVIPRKGATSVADKSAIEWTDASWNPIVGCSIVSPGCTNCYAMKMAARIEHMGGSPHYDDLTQDSKAGPVWTGKVAMAPDHILTQPLRWKRGRKIFVNSMGDLFHESIGDEQIDKVFAVMALCPQHTFQVLTKRAERMRAYFDRGYSAMGTPKRCMLVEEEMTSFTAGKYGAPCAVESWPLPNVWLGVSTERQQEADERIPLLLQTPAAVRFISAEPLLGPIDLSTINTCSPGYSTTMGANLDWVIVGGESGHGARPMHPDWARSLREQCAAAGVPFFFKQRGEWSWTDDADYDADRVVEVPLDWRERKDGKILCMRQNGTFAGGYGGDSAEFLVRLGKKSAGRLLDGKEHNEFPNARTNA